MIDKEEIIESLRLFNDKVRKLEHSRFVTTLSQPDSGFTMSGVKNEEGYFDITADRRGPDDEAIAAATLTFRFFNQDNDRISLRRMSEYYANAQVSETLKKEFEKTRAEINEFLDSPQYSISNFNDTALTRRELVETFIYGELAHANKAKAAVIEAWRPFPPIYLHFEHEFIRTLGLLFRGLRYIAAINEDALTELCA